MKVVKPTCQMKSGGNFETKLYFYFHSFLAQTLPILGTPLLRSCWELFEAGYTEDNGATSGLYMIEPKGPDGTDPGVFQVYCDLDTGKCHRRLQHRRHCHHRHHTGCPNIMLTPFGILVATL